MKASKSLQNDQSTATENALRRAVDTTPAFIHTARPDGYLDPREIRKLREDLPIYIFAGSKDPVGQRLEGLRVLIDRYRSAGLTSISHDFYTGGRHEMLQELNRSDVTTNLLVWIASILGKAS
jgi:alpha-beta hydrolase superfamily lysophospholipase